MGPGEWLSLFVLQIVRYSLVLLRGKLEDPGSGISWESPGLLVFWNAGAGWGRELILEEGGLTKERLGRAMNEDQMAFALLVLTRRAGVRHTGRSFVPPGGTETQEELEMLLPPSFARTLAGLSPEEHDARAMGYVAPFILGGSQLRLTFDLPAGEVTGERARRISVPLEPGLSFDGDAAGRMVSGSFAVAFHPLEAGVGDAPDRYPVSVMLALDPERVFIDGESNAAGGLSGIRGVTADSPDPSSWTAEERAALWDGLLGLIDRDLEAYPGKVLQGYVRLGAGPAQTNESQAVTGQPFAALTVPQEVSPVRILEDGPTRLDRKALELLNSTNGLNLPRSLSSVKRWDELVREEVNRIHTEHGDEALKAKPGIRGKLLERRSSSAGVDELRLTEEAQEALLANVGHRGYLRNTRDEDGVEREYLVKRFRAGGGFVETSLSWYGLASPLAEDETRREEDKLRQEQRRLSQAVLFQDLDAAQRQQVERKLRRFGSINDAREVARAILYRFGQRGENPLRFPAHELRLLLECESDPNGLARVKGALRALQELRFVLRTSGIGPGLSVHTFGAFLGDVSEVRRGRGGHGDGDFYVSISDRFVGCLRVFNTAHYRIKDAHKVFVFDWRKELAEGEKANLSERGFLRGFSSLAPYYDKAAGLTDSQRRLREWLEHNLTRKKDPTARGRETARARKTATDGDEPRVYDANFCPLLPPGGRFHGALGHYQPKKHGGAERGRTLGGTPKLPSTSGKSGGRTAGLLNAMGYTLPRGAAQRRRQEVYEKALQDIRAVVVEHFGGVAAGHTTDGRWLRLEDVDGLSEQDLGRGVSWCLFLPEDWQDKRREGLERYQAERHARGETPYLVKVSMSGQAEEEPAARSSWKRLFGVRRERKLSQAEVGRLFGVSQATVAYWEAGPEPGDDGRVRGKQIPAYLEPLLRRWIEAGTVPTADELAAVRGEPV